MYGMTDNYVRKGQTGEPTNNIAHFGTHKRTADDITLAATATAVLEPIVREVPVSWYEMELPSSRHRKFVPVEKTGSHLIEIRQVPVEDAPEAFERRYEVGYGDDKRTVVQTYRVIDGELFTNVDRWNERGFEDADEIARKAAAFGRGSSYQPETKDELTGKMDALARSYVIIDGQTWARTAEPVYKVMTFGLGSNHGGTSLSIDDAPDPQYGIADESLFPADRYNDALEHALNVAENRGDDKSIDRIKSTEPITVIGGAFHPGSTWLPAPRIEYTRPYHLNEDTYQQDLEKFRDGIFQIPGAVTTEPDGRGGMRRRLDYTKMSDRQVSDYKDYLKFAADNGLF